MTCAPPPTYPGSIDMGVVQMVVHGFLSVGDSVALGLLAGFPEGIQK